MGLLQLALILALAGCVAPVQIVYTSDHAASFVDGDGQSQPYVVGFAKEGQPLPPPTPPHRSTVMRTANGTAYRCYIPEAASSEGPAASGSLSTATQGSLSPQKTASELLEALGDHCYYRIEEWWTYELCYRKQLRQYHKEAERVVSQYIMGVYSSQQEQQQQQEDEVQVDSSDVTGATKYVAQQYGEGQECELTGKPRQAEVRYTCGTSGDTLLASVKELASCSYVVTVTTPRLCKHAAFQQQSVPAAVIQCHPLPAGEAGADGVPMAAAACGTGAQCGCGGQQQAAGTCGAGAGALETPAAIAAAGGAGPHRSSDEAGGPGEGPTASAVADNSTLAAAGGGDGDTSEEDLSLLQSLVQGGGEYEEEYGGGEDDEEDPYL